MKVTDIKPQGTKLIVKPIPKKEEDLGSGIIAPETANADLQSGEVIAVGVELIGKINIGDTVLHPSKKGVSQNIEQTFYLWLDAEPSKEEIWAVISK